jgi:hypothetical protein
MIGSMRYDLLLLQKLTADKRMVSKSMKFRISGGAKIVKTGDVRLEILNHPSARHRLLTKNRNLSVINYN